MACTTAVVKIKLRRDTASVWTSTNPLLALGESGYESNTHQMKVGNGVLRWNDLPYLSMPSPAVILDGGDPWSIYVVGSTNVFDFGGVV